MNILFVHEDKKEIKDINDRFNPTNLDVTYINFTIFNQNLHHYFINFDLIFIELTGEEEVKSKFIKQYTKYAKNLQVSIIYTFKQMDFNALSKNLRLDNFDYLLEPFNDKHLLNKIKLYNTSRCDTIFENSKMSIKGKLLRSLEHQWKQPLNFISTNLLNLEIKSELEKLEHQDIEKTNKNIELAINKISNTISKFNQCFNSSNSKTNFSINNAIQNNMEIILHKITNNNIILNQLSQESDLQIFNYENDFSLNIILLLNILIESSILENEDENETVINFYYETKDKKNHICISLNKSLSFNSIIDSYHLEFSVIKMLLKKTSMSYSSILKNNNTHIKISL